MTLCRRFGHLEDLVQAGGGNISVKVSDSISLIKSSGVALCDVTKDKGYTVYDHGTLSANLDVPLDAVVVAGPAPSLETYFHCFLKRIVVHLHPTAMLPRLCRKTVPDAIPYCKPGVDLAKLIRSSWKGEPTLLLQNHGLIITGETVEEVMEVSSRIYELYRSERSIPLPLFWSVQDIFPDHYVYKVCHAETGVYLPILHAFNVRNLTPDIALFLHKAIHTDGPFLFLHAPTKSKCLAILEVLRSYCECVSPELHALTEMQVADILYWPAELNRKTM